MRCRSSESSSTEPDAGRESDLAWRSTLDGEEPHPIDECEVLAVEEVSDPLASPDPLIDRLLGQLVAGRYRVEHRIGEGGMGTIYRVVHEQLRRRFAMKVLSPLLCQDQEALLRFRREAEIVARLSHSAIVEVVGWEQVEGGIPCMIMEYLEGVDLARHLESVGPLPWREIGEIVFPILSALRVAHRAGVVHRDLKPGNIFLARDDNGELRPKLLDFGISKIQNSESLLQTGNCILGTPAYMAPEQAGLEPAGVGEATDVWAMGAILYEMAAGRPAFDGATLAEILRQIYSGKIVPLRELRPDAPDELGALIGRMLERSPSRRIPDMVMLKQQLIATLPECLPDPPSGERRPVDDTAATEMPPHSSPGHRGFVRRSWLVMVAALGLSVTAAIAKRSLVPKSFPGVPVVAISAPSPARSASAEKLRVVPIPPVRPPLDEKRPRQRRVAPMAAPILQPGELIDP